MDVADAAPAAAAGAMNDEDALLQQALAMSMAENQGEAPEEAAAGDDDDDDDAMQMALAMSMQGEGEEKTAEGGPQFQDPAFVNQLLGSLPGVNPDDPAIQEALRKATEDAEKSDKKDEGKKDE